MATALKSKSDVITAESSLMVTQNILAVLLSQLCYVRNIFPEEAFNESKFGNCIIRALQQGVDDEADRLLKWLEEGVFSTLRRGSLVMMVLGIFLDPRKSSEFIEAWYFRVSCGGQVNILRERDGTTKSMLVGTTREQVKDLSQNFVRSGSICSDYAVDANQCEACLHRTVIALGGALRDLPKERYLTMRIVHENDGTERPVGWEDAQGGQPFISYAQKPTKLSLGSLATPFNSLGLQLKTTVEDEGSTNEEIIMERYLESQIEAMWDSDSDEDDAPVSMQEHTDGRAQTLSDMEIQALRTIMECREESIDERTHPLFRFQGSIVLKMIEIGALNRINVGRNQVCWKPNALEASRLYQRQCGPLRAATPDLLIQMSQIAVSSPASSTIYADFPNFGKGNADFAATVPNRRVYPAVIPSAEIEDSQEEDCESEKEACTLVSGRSSQAIQSKQESKPAGRGSSASNVQQRATRVSKKEMKSSRVSLPRLDFEMTQSQSKSRRGR